VVLRGACSSEDFRVTSRTTPRSWAPDEPLLTRLDDMAWDERVACWSDLESLGARLAALTMTPGILWPAFDVRIVESSPQAQPTL